MAPTTARTEPAASGSGPAAGADMNRAAAATPGSGPGLAPHPVSRLRIADEAVVRINEDPYTGVLALACAGVRDRIVGRDSPAARAAERLTAEEVDAIARVIHPQKSLAPDCLTPDLLAADTTVGGEVERLRSLSVTDLQDDLEQTFAGDLPWHWAEIAETPRQWAGAVAGAVARLWERIEPTWHAQQVHRRREGERISFAAARGALDVALSGIHPRATAHERTIEIPDTDPSDVGIEPQTIVLAPTLAGLDLSVFNLDRSEHVWFGYSLPPLRDTDHDALATLLTPLRAELLLTLGREHSMSQLATTLYAAPPTITYQIGVLVSAGLVTRRKEGRRTLVLRTPRGTDLIESYRHS